MTFFCLVVIALAPWWVVRAACCPTYCRVVPRLVLKLAVLLALYFFLVAAVTVFLPNLLLPLAVLALGVIIVERWVARPGYGKAKNLPPGSLALIDPRCYTDDLYYVKQAEKFGPVFKMRELFKPTVCVVGLDRGIELQKEHEDKSFCVPRFGFERHIPGRYLAVEDPEKHATFRKQMIWMFSNEVLDAHAPLMEQTFREELSRAARGCDQEPSGGVRTRLHLHRMIWASLLPLYFGIDVNSEKAQRIKTLSKIIDIRNPTMASVAKVGQAVQDLEDEYREQAEQVDVDRDPPCFISRLRQKYPEASVDGVVLRNLSYLLHTTWGDLTGINMWLIKTLTEHPQWIKMLRDEMEAPDGGTTIMDQVIKEMFRLEQMELHLRNVEEDITYDGFTIPKGWNLRICVRASHRLSDAFEDPRMFDPSRFKDRSYKISEYQPFGAGPHSCIGVPITMMACRAWLRALLGGFDWEVTDDGPIELGTYRHWRPSSRFRTRLKPRI